MTHDRYGEFPTGFFARQDDNNDRRFYTTPRLVTHIDDRAIAAVGQVYQQVGAADGRVLDLMSSWISHFVTPPDPLIALGMNRSELAANTAARGALVADLNDSPGLPFVDNSFDAAVCCVSIDYLTKPLEVFDEVARVVVPGGVFCCSFSNRCFPTKAIAGWLGTGDREHVELVARYFALSGPWTAITATVAIEPGHGGDPLYAVWATVSGDGAQAKAPEQEMAG